MRKRHITSVLSITAASFIVLTGCGGTSMPDESGEATQDSSQSTTTPEGSLFDHGITDIEYALPDGTVVTCITYTGIRSSTMSCDWDNAQRPDDPTAEK